MRCGNLEDVTPQPPIGVEEWVDFILAAAAHRAHEVPHQRFGESLLTRYFEAVPGRYAADPVASAYFDNILCTVASAIRAFSVQRDVFQTQWESHRRAQEANRSQVERLEKFAPLTGSLWGKALAVVAGLGVGAPLGVALKAYWDNVPVITLAVVAAAVVTGALAFELLINLTCQALRIRAEYALPADVLQAWEDGALNGYRKILRQFMPLAVEITNRYYPGAYPVLSEDAISAAVERHLAFKPRPRPANPPAKQ